MRLSPLFRTLFSLILYAGIYYLIFRDAKSIALLLAVIIVHECGHFIAMRSFGYSNVRMLFVPMFGAFVSGQPAAVDPGKKMIVLFAGPLPGIIIGMVCAYAYSLNHQHIFYLLALMFIFLNVFNLFPLSPMDGGQMLKLLFPGYNKWVQTVFIVMASLALALITYITGNYLLVLLILLLWLRLVALWRPITGDSVSEGADKELTDMQKFFYLLIWLGFMILPIITLFRITR